VIDYLVEDLPELLNAIDGKEIETEGGKVTLHTRDAAVVPVEMWWGEQILSLLSDPNLAFILLMLGFYGILFEFYTPGWGVAGTAGIICLVLAFFGLAVLPVNYAGLVLIFVAIGLFVAEAFIPSFGMLTVGGGVCLILGGIMLVDTPLPLMRVSLSVLIPMAVGSAIVAFFLATRAFHSFRIPVQTGAEGMVGERATASEPFAERDGMFIGTVLVHGEVWRAESNQQIVKGDRVKVTKCEGLTLSVTGTSGNVHTQGSSKQ
jgi:membrane-bound serine protease (ClpP class)